jgi:hypothetical protein
MTEEQKTDLTTLVDKLKENLSEDEKKLLDQMVASGLDLSKADSDGDGVPDVKGIKALFFKDGKFSKTATFAVLGNILVLLNYALMSWLAGAHVTLSWIEFTIPAFSSGDAAAILGVLNGTYLGNNYLKSK